MPIVKENKQLDGPNSIYSASRKVASRQLKNMKSVALDDAENTASKNPIPTSTGAQDTEGLIPQLLQNLSDVNGLMSSLKLVGGKSDEQTPPNTPVPYNPKKRPRKGAGRGGSRKSDDIKKLKDKIDTETSRKRDAEANLKKLQNSPTPSGIDTTVKNERIAHYKQEIVRATGNIKNHQRKIAVLEKEQREEEGEQAPKPEPNQPRNLQERGNQLFDQIRGYLNDARDGGGLNENTQDLLNELNEINDQLGRPNLYLDMNRFQLVTADNAGIPPPGPIQKPEEKEEEDQESATEDEDDDEDDDDDGDDVDISNFDFAKVSKSTLLVILNQLKSLVKRGDLTLKRIINGNISAGQSELDTITDELSELISSKRFLLSHIAQISRKGKDIAEYLYSILSTMVGKYIESLKTYVKRYAQLNREQINSIQEGDVVEGGERHFAVSNRPVVLSDAVRHISNYDRKYLL